MKKQKRTPLIQKLILALISLSFLGLMLISVLYLYLQSQLPNVDALKTVQLQVPLRIYTEEGQLIQEYGEKRRIPVAYNDIPPMLIKALLATEDQRFFEHGGVDIRGLGRAFVTLIQTGQKSQGGSTITMQVARNFFLSRKKTFLRKFNEILLAIKIDNELPKEKILELYMNKIYLGNRAYGIGAAAQIYYGKTLKELTLGEIAMIAGLPQAPSVHNPIANPTAAKIRRDHVLQRLLEEGFITQIAYQEAINEPIIARYHGSDVEVDAPYVAEMVRQALFDKFGEDAYTKGYKVYTTIKAPLQVSADTVTFSHLLAYDKQRGYRGAIDTLSPSDANNPLIIQKKLASYPSMNELTPAFVSSVSPSKATIILPNNQTGILPFSLAKWARKALANSWNGPYPKQLTDVLHINEIVYVQSTQNGYALSQIPDSEISLVTLNPKNGAIMALVGGFNFKKSKFNRATQSIRQPGSSFKPFIYASALDKQYTLSTIVNDSPIVINDPSQPNSTWRPHNDNKTFNGPMRLKQALMESRNLVSIRILDDIGVDYAIQYIAAFGFDPRTMPKTLSLALGTLSTTPLELTTAYATFANSGYKVTPYIIQKITDNQGNLISEANPPTACKACNATKAPKIISDETAFLMTTALQGVIQHGTAARAGRELNREDFAGKTGTTNDQVDAWFVGFNPDMVTTTWVGYDTPKTLHRYAASLALPIWIDYVKRIIHYFPPNAWPQPDKIVAIKVSRFTGSITSANDPNGITEYFKEDELPDADISPNQIDSNLNSNITPSDIPSTNEHLF